MPIAIVSILGLTLPALVVALFPAWASIDFALSMDSKFKYTPAETWLWRALVLLAVTHAGYLCFRLACWLERRVSDVLFPVWIVAPLSLFSCFFGALLSERDALHLINQHLGKPEIVEAVLHSKNIDCTSTSSRRRPRFDRDSVQCNREALFDTASGRFFFRGSTADYSINVLKPGDRAQLAVCRTLLGSSLMWVDPTGATAETLKLSVWRKMQSRTHPALPCASNEYQPASPSVMDGHP